MIKKLKELCVKLNKLEIINKIRVFELERIIEKYIELGLTDKVIYERNTKIKGSVSEIIEIFERIIGIQSGSIKKVNNSFWLSSCYECDGSISITKEFNSRKNTKQINTYFCFDEENYEGEFDEIEKNKLSEIYDPLKYAHRELKYLLDEDKVNELGFIA